MHVIYTIQNKLNYKLYVGQSSNYKKRWSDHKRVGYNLWLEKITADHPTVQVIHRAMAKYGIDNFEFTVLEEFDNQKEADEAERFWISFFRSRNRAYGYNSIPGGRFGIGSGPDHPNYGKPAHNRLFTDEREKEICQRYTNEQLSTSKLGEIYNCSFGTIYKILKRNNVEILGNRILSKGKYYSPETGFQKGQVPHNKLFNKKQELEICRLYSEEKVSTTEISEIYECHRTVIINLLNRYNVEMRDRGYYNKGKSPTNKLLSEEMEMKICRRYQNEEVTITKLAEEYNCDRSVISKALDRHDIKKKKKGFFKKGVRSKRRLFDDEEEKAICQEYERGMSATAMAKKYGCDKTVILGVLKRNNILIRKNGANLRGKPPHNKLFSEEQEKEICNRYVREKLSLAALGREYGCNYKTISNILDRYGAKQL